MDSKNSKNNSQFEDIEINLENVNNNDMPYSGTNSLINTENIFQSQKSKIKEKANSVKTKQKKKPKV